MAATSKSASSHSAPAQSLEDRIAESFSTSVFPDNHRSRFIPRDKIEDLITPYYVETELFEGNSAKDQAGQELIKYVTSSAGKLFVISILCNVRFDSLRKAMEKFKEDKFGDKDLPVFADAQDYPACLKNWKALAKSDFRIKQWEVMVPVFPSKFERMYLKPEHILPFTYVDSQRKEGTFGDVYQVTIHPSHQESPMEKFDKSPANAALKELKASANETHTDAKDKGEKVFKEWQAEAQALEDTSILNHPHIVSVKSIFTKGTRHYFLFQWAEWGSLRDLYRQDWRSHLTEAIVKEVLIQLKGLAEGLSELHNFQQKGKAKAKAPAQPQQSGFLEVPGQTPIDESYRHGDLKPDNILRFADESRLGMWKIADMGLAKHHHAATVLRGPTITTNATPSYEPPEVYTLPDQGRSRQYDIWSMGCIILELLVWLLYGPEALDHFSRSMNRDTGQVAPYWEFVPGSNKKEARLRDNVLRCMEHIRDDPECQQPTAIRDLLRIVEKRLLIVPLPDPPGSPSTSSHAPEPAPGPFRARAGELHQYLKEIQDEGDRVEANRVKGDRGTARAYWFTGTKRDGIIGPLASTPKGPELQVRIQHYEFG